jgi:hypothetical protein
MAMRPYFGSLRCQIEVPEGDSLSQFNDMQPLALVVVQRGGAAIKHVGPNPSTDGFGPGASAARPYGTRIICVARQARTN